MEFFVWIAIGLVAAAVGLWYVHRTDPGPFRPSMGEVLLYGVAAVAFGIVFGTLERELGGGRGIMVAAISVLLSAAIAIGIEARHHRSCYTDEQRRREA